MVDRNVIAEKLKQLAQRIAKIRELCPAGLEGLAGDALDLVSFNLFLAVQTCVDLATHLIGDESWEPAATNREAFERLHEHGVISQETVRAFRQAIGLRNVVAHGYGSVDPAQIHSAATTGLPDLERFAAELSAWVEGRIGTAGA
ncbi:MAG TPA: DUF86 domain-containing protein [Thermoanaerobaculia bacterium]|nr:DUF86 domain-containing protein [Thermoanaerobaculia bacterium]